MEEWKKSYFNRRNWILENINELDIDCKEALLLLYIDYAQEFKLSISTESLSEHLPVSQTEANEIIKSLMDKKYLILERKGKGISFSLNNVFAKPLTSKDDVKLFDLFQQQFGRPIVPNEIEMLKSWQEKYDEKLIVDALRDACVYQKMSFKYINAILANKENEK